MNLSQEDFVINDGERIAQVIIAKHEQAEWIEVEQLMETAARRRRIWAYRQKINQRI